MAQNIAIVGIGETAYSSNSGMTGPQLLLQACRRAIADAGLKTTDIDGVIVPRIGTNVRPFEFGFYLHCPLRYVAYCGMEAGAGAVNSIEMAAQALADGKAKYVLIFTGANQKSDAKNSNPGKFHMDDPYKRNLEIPFGFYPQPVYFASMTRRYMNIYGDVTEQMGRIAVNSRRNACLNDNAQMKKPMTLEDYYNYPVLYDPFRIVDCCLVTDGACAFVVTTEERAKDLPVKPVMVRGIATAGIDHITEYFFSQETEPLATAARKTAPIAFAQAGLTVDDISIAEIYDSFAVNTICQLEDIGFCGHGEFRDFIGDGSRISLEGDLPLNTHGGLLSQGYIFGMNHIIEAVKQIRGTANEGRQVKNVKSAFVSGFGGWFQGSLILSL